MPSRYVLDASAGVDILQHTTEGEALAPRLRAAATIELWTVEHFHVEVGVLAGWPLEVVSVAPLLEEAWQLRHNVTVHDALYVVLTRHLPEAVLVSTDRRLPAAPGVDVQVITPDQLLP